MALTDHTPTSNAPTTDDRSTSVLRVAVYIVAGLALCVAAWALVQGDQRDLWSQTSTVGLSILASCRGL